MNPIQNSLLELKVAGIRALEQPEFFALFGHGGSPEAPRLYQEKLRSQLRPYARAYWDRHIEFFQGNRHGALRFYYRGKLRVFWGIALNNAQKNPASAARAAPRNCLTLAT